MSYVPERVLRCKIGEAVRIGELVTIRIREIIGDEVILRYKTRPLWIDHEKKIKPVRRSQAP